MTESESVRTRGTPAQSRRRRRWVLWILPLAALAGLAAVARMSVETRQGVDFTVSTYTMPLYAKALDFVQRDSTYARLVRRLVTDQQSPEARALTLFEWTRTNIRDTPDGFPVVDDHVTNIIIRGYGVADQKADVFTTLATYAGVPAFVGLSATEKKPHVLLSFAWIAQRWRVFDVENGIVFRKRRGELASADELASDGSLIAAAAAGRTYRSRPYELYFEGFQPPVAPDILRAELQMLWPRTTHRMMRMAGLGRREWENGP